MRGAAAYGFSAADPSADLTPWAPGPVTCLGDAVHAMPPTGGRAAATAVRDADALATQLAAVRAGTATLPAGTATLPAAVGAFHAEMGGYAPGAVRESLAPLRWIRATSGPGAVLAGRAALPLAASVAQGYRALRGRSAARHP